MRMDDPRTPGDDLADAVRQELLNYSPHWIVEHLRDDHLITLDHKDERMLMETLQALQEALERYESLRGMRG